MKAIVLTCDKYRVMTEHMILQYAKLWPQHPFTFRIPYQTLAGTNSTNRQYIKTPSSIKATVLQLLEDLDEEEWIYWCLDDKYPIRLLVEQIELFMADLALAHEMSGLLFCRCRTTLDNPQQTLYPGKVTNSFSEVYLERKTWAQIWIHQFVKVKVIRHLFMNFPDDIPQAIVMDQLKFLIEKPSAYRLFVTEKNFAIFGESTEGGKITQNCHDSIVQHGLELPSWFSQSNGKHVLMGQLSP